MLFRMNSVKLVVLLIVAMLSCFILYNNPQCTRKQSTYNSEAQTFEERLRHFDAITGTPFLLPGDEVLRNLDESDLMRVYWRYVNTIQTLCRNHTRLGVTGDGGKEVCLDEKFRPSKPCNVYSFGSNYQFDFDLKAYHYLGCDVYTYDPTMDITKGKPIPKEIRFFQTGIAGKDYIDEHKWQMKTLKTIMKDNNHENSVIDIVKMDVEGSEWDSIPNMIESGVHKQIKQFLVEVHVGHEMADPKRPIWGNTNIAQQLQAIRLLYENGFRIFMREHVLGNMLRLDAPPHDIISTQNELALLNMRFLLDKQ